MREADVAPVERLKLWLATPWPELPNGTVGRTSATGCFLAAFDSGGCRASTRRMLILDGPWIDGGPYLRAGQVRDPDAEGGDRSSLLAMQPIAARGR